MAEREIRLLDSKTYWESDESHALMSFLSDKGFTNEELEADDFGRFHGPRMYIRVGILESQREFFKPVYGEIISIDKEGKLHVNTADGIGNYPLPLSYLRQVEVKRISRNDFLEEKDKYGGALKGVS